MSITVTSDLLNVTRTGAPIAVCEQKGWKWRRLSWVEEMIKFSARQYKDGVPVDKIIDWTDSERTRGNNFDSLETFYQAMVIAETEFQMSGLRPRSLWNLTFPEVRAIIRLRARTMPPEIIRKRFQLRSDQDLDALVPQATELHARLISALTKVRKRSFRERLE
ncbi:MAG TPA: hypothetical protein VKA68_19115 [bacterium]|nr:hypothetical protein [bacterium]